VNSPQAPSQSDWRAGGYRNAFEHVPRPPRTPTPFARDLIYGYQGSQRGLRTIGAIFLALGLPLVFFVGDGLIADIALATSGKPTTATVVSTRLVTNVEDDGVNPTEIKYSYELDGKKYEGLSYATNRNVVASASTGATIQAEILPSMPSWSRIKGGSSSKLGFSVGLLFLFPIVGAGLLFSAVRANRREIRAFRNGTATKGLVVRRGFDTTTEVGDKNPFEVVWEFQVDGTTYKGKLGHMDRTLLERAFPDRGQAVHMNKCIIDTIRQITLGR